MALLAYLIVSAAVLYLAYRIIGARLTKMFNLRETEDTPAHEMRDGLDYEPARTSYLLPQHFSAIAAAGPIVGPILAGLYFGWGPAWLWIIFGSILIGGIHDFTALVASVRHRARSIAEVVRQHMNPRAYFLFLMFIWFALVYVIIAFTDVTASAFIPKETADGATAPGPAVATSSMIYLGLAVAMGLTLRFTKLTPGKAKLIFLPLVFAAIVAGPYIPLDLSNVASGISPQRLWGYLLLGYCFLAALAPVWMLLQPRGDLGGYFLYIVMIVAVVGIGIGALTGGLHIEQAFFKGWEARDGFGDAAPLFPILFITVACGACSGFHSVVASGTTSKQLSRESDARMVGYGAMLLEGFLACLSLATFMVMTGSLSTPDAIYANGVADFGARIFGMFGLEFASMKNLLLPFALLCFATFVFDTLDACTRLARYVLMEMLGWKTRAQAVAATAICLVIPVIAISLPPAHLNGKPLALWRVFWNIFGSSNQLLAALTLLGVTFWLARKKMAWWIALAPTAFMMVMTLWSLVVGIQPYLQLFKGTESIEPIRHFQFGVSISLLVLSLWLIAEAFITWRSMMKPPEASAVPVQSPAEAG